MMKLFKSALLLASIFAFLQGYAQNIPVNHIKAGMSYKFAQNLEWPNESSLTVFTIGVLTDEVDVAKSFSNDLNKVTIKQKPIKVKHFFKLSDVAEVQALYVGPSFSKKINTIVNELAPHHILVISDEATDKRGVMINFYVENNLLKFEINKANIINAELKIGPSLILLGGTEIDVAKLYKDTQQNLEKEKEKVKEQQLELVDMRKDIEAKRAEIEQQKESIAFQNTEIEQQKAAIRAQNNTLTALKTNVLKQQALLNEKVLLMNRQIATIAGQEAAIKEQEMKMLEHTTHLNKVTTEIEKRQLRINEQKLILDQQNARIEVQQNLLYFFMAFFFLIVALVFVVFNSYRNQKRFNRELAEKGEHIRLGAALLAREKEHTTKSIEYALTIQNAVLPNPEVINEMIESFVLFKPKDIVSGDFFWFYHLPASADSPERIFIAVMDCTGHGVPGAFMSMIGTSLLNEIVREKKIYSPKQIIDTLDVRVRLSLNQKESRNKDGMDACFCVIERKNLLAPVKLTYCGAKRPLYYSVPDSGAFGTLKGDRKSVGGYESKATGLQFSNQDITLPKGSRLYLTTDGFMDQNNPEREKFGLKRFEEMLIKVAGLSLNKQKAVIEETLSKHQAAAQQRDDITLVGIQI